MNNIRITLAGMLITIAGLCIGIVIAEHRQSKPDPTTTIAVESHQTERARIEAGTTTRLAEIQYMAERDRRQDRIYEMAMAGLINRDDTGLYIYCGVIGTICFIGMCAFLFIAWKVNQASGNPTTYHSIEHRREPCRKYQRYQLIPDDERVFLELNDKRRG